MNKSIHQEEITVIKTHAPNSRASKYMREKNLTPKGEIQQ